MRRLLLTVILLCAASSAWAQATATPTNTVPSATPTNTLTNTPTRTPTLSREGMLANQYACPTETVGGSCAVRPGMKANHNGYKTVALVTTDGSGNSTLSCVVETSWLAPEIVIATMSGATCTTAANCLKGFWESCDEVFVTVPAGVTVSAWLKMVAD